MFSPTTPNYAFEPQKLKKVKNERPKMITLHILLFTTMVSRSGSINANMF
jgi:hypothetical protein